ncbi:MAG: LytR C-terminal domain-containing protein [Patescibacteria group bacterium]|jgi:hypothetical protein
MSFFSRRTKRRKQSAALPRKRVNFKTWRRLTEKGGCFLLPLIVLMAFFLGYHFWQEVKHSIWDGKSQLTLAFEQENTLGYIKINPEFEEVTIFTMPPNAMVALAYGYEEYRSDKVKMLAKQENIDFGKFLAVSMTQFLGSTTDGYITDANGRVGDLKTLVLQSFYSGAKTNLTTWDLLRLFSYVINIRSNGVEVISFADTKAFQLETLPDGSEVYVPDLNLLDEVILRELANPSFLNQNLTWEVFNGTNHFGLANSVKRIVANSGFDVIGVRQAQKSYTNSFISVRSLESSASLQKFANYFSLPIETKSGLHDRADVVLVVGEDFWNKYYRRK